MASAVVRPTSAQEVQAIVRLARERGLRLGVRGGGHDWAGRSRVAGGVMIDLSLMREVQVFPDARIAVVSGGALSSDVITASERYGLVTPTGVIGDVGMAALALGGRYGPLNGTTGLALDNVIEVQIVLADGRLVTANADVEPDLFWALRGGSGNFGVVTQMHLRLHPISDVTAGVIAFDWRQAGDVLRNYNALRPTVPDELTVETSIATGPGGAVTVFLWPTWSGPVEGGNSWIEAVAGLGTPQSVDVHRMPYSRAITLLKPYIVSGRYYEMRTVNLATYSPEAIEALIAAGDSRTSLFCGISTHHFHGAATRVPVTDTAFGTREPHFVVEILAAWQADDDAGGTHVAWAEAVHADLAKYALAGGYPNLLGPHQAAQAAVAYGPNAPRVRAAKEHYDPADVFFSAPPLPPNGRPMSADPVPL